MKFKERAKQLKTDILAIYLSLKNSKTPIIAKVLAFITIVYALSPIDLIPDFIPFLGYLDDIIILSVLIAMTIKLIPKEIFCKFQKESEAMCDQEMSEKWYCCFPVLIIWIIILYFIHRLINVI